MIRRFLACLALLIAAPLAAQMPGATPHITPTLVAESLTSAPGKPVTLAFAMHPAPEWHGYWKNPGDAGIETLTDWKGPPGVTFGPLQYPVPQTLLIAGLMNYVYEADYAELVTVAIPAGLAPGTKLPLSVKLDWLACNPSTCVPETATLSITLTVGDGAPDPARSADFAKWRAALPKPLGSAAHFEIANGRFRLEVPLPAAAKVDKPYFYPLADKLIDYAAPQTVTRDGDRLVIETAAKPDAKADKVEGVLKIGEGQGLSIEAVPGKVAAVGAASARSQGGDGGTSFLLAFGGAILGGLLLNVMPCVFPILSLKALSLARAGAPEGHARAEAIAYTAGVILVCLALGLTILLLRAAGTSAGWAFQLQNPKVIAGLMLLVLAIGLNLAGLFELPVISAGGSLAAKSGAAGAFWTGALAAFVATPCAGPFLGVALGAALVLPAAAAMAVFAGLGFGLALPFLLLGFLPALRARLPRPGAWMDTMRRIVSVPMLLTALALAWVLGRQSAVDGMTIGLAAALMLALGLWWAGRRQQALKAGAWWPVVPAFGLAIALVAIVPHNAPAEAATATKGSSLAFDETRLTSLRAEGRPVLLYFTADWCLTCKVNEKAAIERSEVQDAFAQKKVAVMVGDWTNGDPAISKFLAAHGRSGVPFYLFYPAGGGEPKELPQLLTTGLLEGLA